MEDLKSLQVQDDTRPYRKLDSDLWKRIDELPRLKGKQLMFKVLIYMICRTGFSRSFNCRLESTIPIGAGLGSSASMCVCLAALALYSRHPALNHELIDSLAFEGECIIHGNPSGMDNRICTYGGFAMFKEGELRMLDLDYRIPLYIVITHVERRTSEQVERVAEFCRTVSLYLI
jgi:mevalonate kinase